MKDKHRFLFESGKWLGQGTITLSLSNDVMQFDTQWDVRPEEGGAVACTQVVEITGGGEQVINRLRFYEIESGTFTVRLDNAMIGTVLGSGVIDERTLAWEYRDTKVGFEGFEVYELQDDGTYALRGEYASDDQARTIIQGKIQKQEVAV